MILTPRRSNSGLMLAMYPSSVVQTGVKSFGCEKSTAHESPIHSWKRIGPSSSAPQSRARCRQSAVPSSVSCPSYRFDVSIEGQLWWNAANRAAAITARDKDVFSRMPIWEQHYKVVRLSRPVPSWQLSHCSATSRQWWSWTTP